MNTNPTFHSPSTPPPFPDQRKGVAGKIAAGTLVAAALGGLWFQGASVRDELARTKQEMAAMRGEMGEPPSWQSWMAAMICSGVEPLSR